MKRTLTAAAAAILIAGSSQASAAATIVNISAYDASNAANGYAPTPVTQTFGPGTYTASVVGKAGGGLYDAWSVATPAATNWNNAYNYAIGSTTTTVNPYNGARFSTAGDALSAFSSVLSTFTLATETAVTFSIPDYLFRDNTGGVSLGINAVPVPEPATLGLFGLGAAALVMARRRKAAVKA